MHKPGVRPTSCHQPPPASACAGAFVHSAPPTATPELSISSLSPHAILPQVLPTQGHFSLFPSKQHFAVYTYLVNELIY